ncbi:ATP-binding protein [Bacillus sp. Hm123]|uniref:ATP-binding protein n=1 Tax=Bacillus sp. Hm123 TaxID=3450745 RepID=UPI003F42E5CA
MIKADKAFDVQRLYKKMVKRYVPELQDRDDFTVKTQRRVCDKCGSESNSAFLYKIQESTEWIEVPVSDECLDCNKAKELQEFMKKQELQASSDRRERLMKDYLMIPSDLVAAGFKNYKETNHVTARALKEAVEYTKHFLANQEEDRYGLILMGSCGTGKSHLCVAIARTLKEKGFAVGFLTTGALLAKIKTTYSKGASQSEEDIFKDLQRFDLLILDDIGSETGSKDEFAWSKTKLFEVVNNRIGKPTIYTSNFNEVELPQAIGERTFSRMFNKTKFIDVFTDDYRKTLRIH